MTFMIWAFLDMHKIEAKYVDIEICISINIVYVPIFSDIMIITVLPPQSESYFIQLLR